jgi:hypothetical protein
MLPIESSYEYPELSWEMFGELCRAFALKVTRDYHPDVVVGIARAGALFLVDMEDGEMDPGEF